jgi:hypothetical protein
MAGRIRARLGLEVGKRSEAGNWEEYLRHFIRLTREARVLVMINGVVGNNTRRVLEPREFRGFAIADEYAPLVFINGADTKAAQIFTRAHEVAHLWLGKSGISLVRASDLPESYAPDATIERWCKHGRGRGPGPDRNVAGNGARPRLGRPHGQHCADLPGQHPCRVAAASGRWTYRLRHLRRGLCRKIDLSQVYSLDEGL